MRRMPSVPDDDANLQAGPPHTGPASGPASSSSRAAQDAARAGWIAGIAAFALYAATTRGTVASHDAAEFQTLAATGGIAHAGYPACVMLLQLFGHLPFGSYALRANLLSCLSGAVAVGLAAALGARIARSALAGLVAAGAFALSLTWWNESTFAGVHALTVALGALAFGLLLRFARAPSGGAAFLIGALSGLALVSHLTSLALGPPVLVTAVLTARAGRLRGTHVALALAGLLVGLTPMAYLLARDAPGQPMNYIADTLRAGSPPELTGSSPPHTRLERLVWLLSARQYFDASPFHPFGEALLRLRILLLTLLANDLPLLGLPLAAFGGVALWRRRGPAAAPLAAWLAGVLFLVLLAASRDMTRIFFLPGLWILSQLLAVGLAAVQRRGAAAFALAAFLLLAAPLARLSLSVPPGPLARRPLLDQVWRAAPADWSPFRTDRGWEDYAHGVMASVGPQALILTCWREATPLRYARFAEGLRPDVEVRYACRDPEPELPAAEREGRPVYTTYPLTSAMTGGRGFRQIGAWKRGGLWLVRPGASPAGGPPRPERERSGGRP